MSGAASEAAWCTHCEGTPSPKPNLWDSLGRLPSPSMIHRKIIYSKEAAELENGKVARALVLHSTYRIGKTEDYEGSHWKRIASKDFAAAKRIR